MTRQEQTKRGLEAIEMIINFLENECGSCNGLSVHESKFSSGKDAFPDVVFREFAIEVKRVEFLVRTKIDGGEQYYASLNNMSILHDSWNWMKEWSKENKRIPIVIAVMTVGRQQPLFIMFNQEQIDELQEQQRYKKWMQLNSWQVLHEGRIIRKVEDLNGD